MLSAAIPVSQRDLDPAFYHHRPARYPGNRMRASETLQNPVYMDRRLNAIPVSSRWLPACLGLFLAQATIGAMHDERLWPDD